MRRVLTVLSGLTRIERLILIGLSSKYLYAEALNAAVAEAKRGRDVEMYEKAVKCLEMVVPEDPDAVLDAPWMESMTKQVKTETERLDQELKGYKNNLIKESIRVSFQLVLLESLLMTLYPPRWAMMT